MLRRKAILVTFMLSAFGTSRAQTPLHELWTRVMPDGRVARTMTAEGLFVKMDADSKFASFMEPGTWLHHASIPLRQVHELAEVSPDGTRIVVQEEVGQSYCLSVYDGVTGGFIGRGPTETFGYSDVAFVPDRGIVVGLRSSGHITALSLESGEQIWRDIVVAGRSLKYAPVSRRLFVYSVIYGSNGKVSTIDLSTGAVSSVVTCPGGSSGGVFEVSGDGTRAAISELNRLNLIVFDPRSGTAYFNRTLNSSISSLYASPDGQKLVIDHDGMVRCVSLLAPTDFWTSNIQIDGCVFAADGSYVVMGDGSTRGAVQVDMATGATVARDGPMEGSHVVPDGWFGFTYRKNGQPKLAARDFNTGSVLFELLTDSTTVGPYAIASPDQTKIAFYNTLGMVQLINRDPLSGIRSFPKGNSMAFSPDSSTFVWFNGYRIEFYSSADGNWLRGFLVANPNASNTAAFNRLGRYAVMTDPTGISCLDLTFGSSTNLGGYSSFVLDQDHDSILVSDGSVMKVLRLPDFSTLSQAPGGMGLTLFNEGSMVTTQSGAVMNFVRTSDGQIVSSVDFSTWSTVPPMHLLRNQQFLFLGGIFASKTDNPYAVTGNTALDQFRLYRGVLVAGDLQSLSDRDGNDLTVEKGITANQSEAPVQVIVEGVSPYNTADYLTLRAFASANTTGLQVSLALYDWSAGQYDANDQQTWNLETTPVSFSYYPKLAARFVEPGTSRVRARLSVRAIGPTQNNAWKVLLDEVKLESHVQSPG